MNFFFDTHFSIKLVELLDHLMRFEGHNAIHLNKALPKHTPDDVWIRWVGDKSTELDRWIIVTADLGIGRKQVNVEAWKQTDLTIFIFPAMYMRTNLWEQSWRTIKLFPNIIKAAERRPTRQVYSISNGWKFKP